MKIKIIKIIIIITSVKDYPKNLHDADRESEKYKIQIINSKKKSGKNEW